MLLLPTKVVNKKNMPKRKKQNVIVCCNHTSNFDAVVLDIRLRHKLYYLSKKEMFKNKFFGFFLKKLGCIKVDRSKPDITAIKTCLKTLNEGKNLGVFPQGTRGQEGDIDVATVKDGVAVFSLRTGKPVLPMALVRKPKIFRRNMLVVGELIYPDMERSKDKVYAEEFTALIVKQMNDLRHQGEELLYKKKKAKKGN